MRILRKSLGLLALLAVFASLPTEAEAARRKRELVGTINLNTASIQQLDLLPGVGPATARRIVEMRERRPFTRPWEVMRVKGIGPAFFRKHKARLKVEGETDLAWVEVRRGETDLRAAR